YRSPELLLSESTYGLGVDMWSVGCIFGELLSGKPLFRAGSYVLMLHGIQALVGSPRSEDLGFVGNAKSLRFLAGLPRCEPANFAAVFPTAPPAALDLLRRMLTFDPRARVTAAEALAH
ncbi:unnamed protein product, partial [Phaeothamnion confervicola]